MHPKAGNARLCADDTLTLALDTAQRLGALSAGQCAKLVAHLPDDFIVHLMQDAVLGKGAAPMRIVDWLNAANVPTVHLRVLPVPKRGTPTEHLLELPDVLLTETLSWLDMRSLTAAAVVSRQLFDVSRRPDARSEVLFHPALLLSPRFMPTRAARHLVVHPCGDTIASRLTPLVADKAMSRKLTKIVCPMILWQHLPPQKFLASLSAEFAVIGLHNFVVPKALLPEPESLRELRVGVVNLTATYLGALARLSKLRSLEIGWVSPSDDDTFADFAVVRLPGCPDPRLMPPPL